MAFENNHLAKRDDDKISIIIPIFNVEDFLEKALDTIINQKYINLEIICVNDGSTDGSLKILREYEKRDPRIIILDQENQGVSAARNKGLASATGTYIYFFDSDDLLELNAMEICLEFMKENALDVILFEADTFSEGIPKEKFIPYQTNISSTKVLQIEEFFEHVLISHSPPWLYFFRREFLERYRLQFYEGIIREDSLFITEVLIHTNQIGFLKMKLFQRRIRPNSIMTSRNTKMHIYGHQTVLLELRKLSADSTLSETSKMYVERKIKNVYLQLSQYYIPFSLKQFSIGKQAGLSLSFQFFTQYKTIVFNIKKHKNKKKLDRML